MLKILLTFHHNLATNVTTDFEINIKSLVSIAFQLLWKLELKNMKIIFEIVPSKKRFKHKIIIIILTNVYNSDLGLTR